MNEERNQNQIIRKDARNCFVESLSDSFAIERIHLVFATYDVSKPVGQRQTNNIHIYIAVDEFLELCRKLSCGELRYMLQAKRDNRDSTPLFQSLGGTSATVVDPKLVVKKALDKGASAMIMVHNHPSGNPRPGQCDLTETERMKKAANTFDIALLDHVIICDDCFFSFADDRVEMADKPGV